MKDETLTEENIRRLKGTIEHAQSLSTVIARQSHNSLRLVGCLQKRIEELEEELDEANREIRELHNATAFGRTCLCPRCLRWLKSESERS